MKKLFTFCLSLIFGGVAFTAQAQVDNVFQFCYEDGTIVPDGSTVTVNTVESDYFGEPFIDSGLFVKNTSEENVYYTLHYSIKECPSGGGVFGYGGIHHPGVRYLHPSGRNLPIPAD